MCRYFNHCLRMTMQRYKTAGNWIQPHFLGFVQSLGVFYVNLSSDTDSWLTLVSIEY